MNIGQHGQEDSVGYRRAGADATASANEDVGPDFDGPAVKRHLAPCPFRLNGMAQELTFMPAEHAVADIQRVAVGDFYVRRPVYAASDPASPQPQPRAV